jgi:hypothetical protein
MNAPSHQARPSRAYDTTIITREEVVAEAEVPGEVELYDYLLKETGPFTRNAWAYHRWCHRCLIELTPDERNQFVAVEEARRYAWHN